MRRGRGALRSGRFSRFIAFCRPGGFCPTEGQGGAADVKQNGAACELLFLLFG